MMRLMVGLGIALLAVSLGRADGGQNKKDEAVHTTVARLVERKNDMLKLHIFRGVSGIQVDRKVAKDVVVELQGKRAKLDDLRPKMWLKVTTDAKTMEIIRLESAKALFEDKPADKQ